ncbi:MAG: SLC13 family permease, partial [Thermoanaerobaculia bacterium]
MTWEIAVLLVVLGGAIVLFVTDKVRVDVVALLVLVTLALTGLVAPKEALSGFSNPAVVTVWAVFILSGGLARTGVASWVGRQVLRLAGSGELGLVTAIMLTAGSLSAFMNNVGVAALLLPVVMDIARRTGRSPSKLLIPLAFSSLLGGLTTLIGTPPNLLISEALRESGLPPFRLFDFTPVGLSVMLAGVAFMALAGRHLLPSGGLSQTAVTGAHEDLRQLYNLREKLFVVRLSRESALAGRTLAESRLGSALGLNVIGILGNGGTRLAPDPGTILRSGDRLLVGGDLEQLAEIRGREYLDLETDDLDVRRLISSEIQMVDVELLPGSDLVGLTLSQADFRHRFGAIVLAVRRSGTTRRTNLERLHLEAGDVLLVQGTLEQLEKLRQEEYLLDTAAPEAEISGLEERLMVCRVPEDSSLAGKTLAESRLGHAFGLGVMGIVRGGETHLMPDPWETLMPGDALLVKGRREDLSTAEGLHDLQVESDQHPDLRELETERVGLAEVVLAPRTTLAGKSLADVHFREKYGLNVIAISREGKTHRRDLGDLALRFADAFLLY